MRFDDFRTNGLLLPSTEAETVRIGMPLHRGPHPRYNEMVMARVGQIEETWSAMHRRDPVAANAKALFRIEILQDSLRDCLIAEYKNSAWRNPSESPMILNRNDPVGTGFDFTELDAMANSLWQGTEEPRQ